MEQDFKKEEVRGLYEKLLDLQNAVEDFWESVPIPLCSTNPVLNILDVGETFKSTFGYKEEEIIGENLDRIFLEEEVFDKIKEKLFREGAIKEEEAVLVSKKRKDIIGNVYARARKDQKGEVVGYIFSFLDVSEKKKVEEELQRKVKDLERFAKELKSSRAALLNILEDVEEARGLAEIERDKTLGIVKNFPEGLLFFDKNNKLSSINPKVREFFNLSSSYKLIGKELREFSKEAALAPLVEVLGGELEEIPKQEIQLKGGLILELLVIGVKRGNEKIGTLVILRDVTRERLIERLKTEFVSIAAHQLRTPLSAIKWTLRMILDGDIGEVSGEQRQFLERTYKSNERMIHLINDLLNVTRIEEGRFLYNVREQDIIKVAEGVIPPLKEIAERKGLKLIFDSPAKEIPALLLDAEKISLVFQNLIDNAINYSRPEGEVRVSIEYLEGKREVLVSVSDQGIGIPEDQKRRVFSRFFRAANAIRAETEGTGLGLYIVKNIIDAHQGKIWFESKEGRGTTFYFTLPVK